MKTKIKSLKFKSLNAGKKRLFILLAVFLFSAVFMRNIIFAAILCILYLYFDWHIGYERKCKLVNLMNKQIIEALNIIKNAVQAGQSLQNAINAARSELSYPLKLEFEKMSDNLALGVNFDKVLMDISQNTRSKEFKLMIDTVRISKDTGASLSAIFERITDTVSQRIAVRAKIVALTAQGRMSGNIVSIIPFVVLFIMYIVDPDMIKSLFVTLPGNILLLIVVIMALAGLFIIRKMTEIDF
jgi:tight adherence protein B